MVVFFRGALTEAKRGLHISLWCVIHYLYVCSYISKGMPPTIILACETTKKANAYSKVHLCQPSVDKINKINHFITLWR